MSTQAFSTPSGTAAAGSLGAAYSIGKEFDVVAPITVTALGAFDALDAAMTGTLVIHLYKRSDMSILATVSFDGSAAGFVQGGHRFFNLATPLNLAAGFQGAVVWGQGLASNGYGPSTTSNTGGGLVSYGRYIYSEAGAGDVYPVTGSDPNPNLLANASMLFAAQSTASPTCPLLFGGSRAAGI